MKNNTIIIVLLFCLICTVFPSQASNLIIPPSPVLTPEASIETFQLEKGFVLELVASEPLIHNPVSISFDEQGRMWCVEMRSYMLDMNGIDEEKPIGVISLLHDDDGDGKADRVTPFLNDLVLPRTVRPVNGGILYIDDTDLWFVENIEDRPGKKTLVYKGFCKGRNMESKPNGLIYHLDNWYYSADCDLRVKMVDSSWVVEATEKRGQWGISQDDFGRLYSNNNSNNYFAEELPPHILYRNKNYQKKSPYVRGSNEIFPIRPTTGINRGYREGMLDEKGRLKAFTAACGLTVYRGNNFPEKYYGSIFVPEPAANLVKLNNIKWVNGKAITSVPYLDSEFIASTDERSRIVNTATAPDGTLYLVDLYHGMLQHAMHLTDYLKEEITSRKLAHPTNLGRIYRLRWTGKEREPEINLNSLSPSELVKNMEHSNAWYREKTQQIIVERKLISTVPYLTKLTRHHINHIKIRALWTLDGLNELKEQQIIDMLNDTDPDVLLSTLRLMTSKNLRNSKRCLEKLQILSQTHNYQLKLALALTLGSMQGKMSLPCLELLIKLTQNSGKEPIIIQAAMSSLSQKEDILLQRLPNESHPLFTHLVNALLKAYPNDQLTQKFEKIFVQSNRNQKFKYTTIQYIAKQSILQRNQSSILTVLDWLVNTDLSKSEINNILKSMKKVAGKRIPLHIEREPLHFQKLVMMDQEKITSRLFVIGKTKNYLVNENDKKQYRLGKEQYLKLCSACHQEHGLGANALAPPLDDSEWVTGNRDRLIAITLNGVSGPIHVSDKLYQAPEVLPIMPGFRYHPDISDDDLANVLTYIRNTWSNRAEKVKPQHVESLRKRLYKTKEPFTEQDLLKFNY